MSLTRAGGKGSEPQFPHLHTGGWRLGLSLCPCDIILWGPDSAAPSLQPWDSGLCSDCLHWCSVLPISLFQPEGAPRSYTYSAFFCPNGESPTPTLQKTLALTPTLLQLCCGQVDTVATLLLPRGWGHHGKATEMFQLGTHVRQSEDWASARQEVSTS